VYPLEISGSFRSICASVFKIEEQAVQDISRNQLASGSLLGLLYKPEDEGNIVVRNAGYLLTDYAAYIT
jgi:hypothetical protein